MMATSAASTLCDSWNTQLFDFKNRLDFCPPLHAADLPQGRILVVEDEAIVALDLQRLLREAGYRVVGPAATPGDVQRLIRCGDVDCAILDLDVDRPARFFIADLLGWADVPFIFLATSPRVPLPPQHRDRPVVVKPLSRATLFAALEQAMAKRGPANDLPLSGQHDPRLQGGPTM